MVSFSFRLWDPNGAKLGQQTPIMDKSHTIDGKKAARTLPEGIPSIDWTTPVPVPEWLGTIFGNFWPFFFGPQTPDVGDKTRILGQTKTPKVIIWGVKTFQGAMEPTPPQNFRIWC